VAEGVGRLRRFGVDRKHDERAISGLYDVVGLGLNYRISEMAAAMGRVQLRHLPGWLEQRQRNFETLAQGLAGLPDVQILRPQDVEATSSHYCLSVVLGLAREPAQQDRQGRECGGVGTSVYYPQPVPRFSYYRSKYGYNESAYPNAAAISDGTIALPWGRI